MRLRRRRPLLLTLTRTSQLHPRRRLMRHALYWTALATTTALALHAYGKHIQHNYRTRIG